MHLLSSDTVSEYHSSPIPCTTESGSLWWPGRMHSCQVLLPCRWWAWEKLFLYRSLIGIFESLLSFTKISVEVYSNVMRCVSTIKCLFNSLHQPSSAKIPSKATPFFGFPPLHSRGFCCDRVYALAFLLQRLDDHKLMIELGLEPQNLWTKFPAIYVFGMVNQKPWYLSFGIFVVKVDLDFWTHLAPLGSCSFEVWWNASWKPRFQSIVFAECGKIRATATPFRFRKTTSFFVMLLVYPGYPF